MEIRQALEAVRNLGVSLNEYDSEAIATLCDFVEDSLPALQAPGTGPEQGVLRLNQEPRI